MRHIGMLLLYLCMAAAAADQVYQWVDSEGHVHYSQTPPPSTAVKAKAVDVTPTAADPAAVQRSQDLAEQQQEANQRAQQTAAKQAQTDAKNKAVMDKYCDLLKSRLALYQQSGRVFTVDAQGNRTYVSDASHDKTIQQLQDEIKAKCAAQ